MILYNDSSHVSNPAVAPSNDTYSWNLEGGHQYLVEVYVDDMYAASTGWIPLVGGSSVVENVTVPNGLDLKVRVYYNGGSVPLSNATVQISSENGSNASARTRIWRIDKTGNDGLVTFQLQPTNKSVEFYSASVFFNDQLVASKTNIRLTEVENAVSIDTSVSAPFSLEVYVKSNVLALAAALISFINLGLYFRDYRWKTHPRLKFTTPKMLEFSITQGVDEYDRQPYTEKNFSFKAEIDNMGGTPTTVKELVLGRTSLDCIPILRALLWNRSKHVQVYPSRLRLTNKSKQSVTSVSAGDSVEVIDSGPNDLALLDALTDVGLDLTERPQGKFLFVMKHTYDNARSNCFNVQLDSSAVEYVRSKKSGT